MYTIGIRLSLRSCSAGAVCVQACMFCPVPHTGNNLSDSITLQYLSVVSWSAGETICTVEPPAVQDGIFVWAESVFCPPKKFKCVELNLQARLVA